MSRIALIGDNSKEYIRNLLNIWRMGDCAVLIDWRIPRETAIKRMNEAGVHECYIEEKIYKQHYMGYMDDFHIHLYSERNNEAVCLPADICSLYEQNYSRNEALILYSSGTTDHAKGIILSFFAIHYNADLIIQYMKPEKYGSIYIVKSLAHSSTIVGELLVGLKTKIRIIVGPTITIPRIILNNIEKFNIAIICVNPTLLGMLVKEVCNTGMIPAALQSIYISGSVFKDAEYKKAHETFRNVNIFNVYGLSETAPRLTAQSENTEKINSVGVPLTDVSINIYNDQGKICGTKEVGNIYVKTPCLFSGYVTGQKVHIDKEGWFNTGDIGYWDDIQELHVIGRSDERIDLQSHKIYPQDIENIILEEFPTVSECIVHTDADGQFLVCHYLGEMQTSQIVRILIKKLALYEIPKKYIWCWELPKTKSGKLKRNISEKEWEYYEKEL